MPSSNQGSPARQQPLDCDASQGTASRPQGPLGHRPANVPAADSSFQGRVGEISGPQGNSIKRVPGTPGENKQPVVLSAENDIIGLPRPANPTNSASLKRPPVGQTDRSDQRAFLQTSQTWFPNLGHTARRETTASSSGGAFGDYDHGLERVSAAETVNSVPYLDPLQAAMRDGPMSRHQGEPTSAAGRDIAFHIRRSMYPPKQCRRPHASAARWHRKSCLYRKAQRRPSHWRR